jgi:hypothetical protein
MQSIGGLSIGKRDNEGGQGTFRSGTRVLAGQGRAAGWRGGNYYQDEGPILGVFGFNQSEIATALNGMYDNALFTAFLHVYLSSASGGGPGNLNCCRVDVGSPPIEWDNAEWYWYGWWRGQYEDWPKRWDGVNAYTTSNQANYTGGYTGLPKWVTLNVTDQVLDSFAAGKDYAVRFSGNGVNEKYVYTDLDGDNRPYLSISTTGLGVNSLEQSSIVRVEQIHTDITTGFMVGDMSFIQDSLENPPFNHYSFVNALAYENEINEIGSIFVGNDQTLTNVSFVVKPYKLSGAPSRYIRGWWSATAQVYEAGAFDASGGFGTPLNSSQALSLPICRNDASGCVCLNFTDIGPCFLEKEKEYYISLRVDCSGTTDDYGTWIPVMGSGNMVTSSGTLGESDYLGTLAYQLTSDKWVWLPTRERTVQARASIADE